jgi:predicted transport protein
VSQEERSIFCEVIVSVILSKKKVYMYMCSIPNGFRDRAISLYSSKTVDKKELLRTVSNIGIYCSSDEVGTVFENSTVNMNALCNSCEDMACCSSVQ